MTIRTDMLFETELSPRIVTLANTATSITMQDLHDTVTDWEDELHLGMAFDTFIASAGKELGEGKSKVPPLPAITLVIPCLIV